MLQSNSRELPLEILQDLDRRVSILNIIVGKLLAMKLLRVRQRILRIHSLIESRLLMRILPIPKILHLIKGDRQTLRELLAHFLRQIIRDHRIIASRMTEHFRR